MHGRTWVFAGGLSFLVASWSVSSVAQDKPKDGKVVKDDKVVISEKIGKDDKVVEKARKEDPPSAERLGKGPTLQETGRVGSMSVETQGLGTPRTASINGPVENVVQFGVAEEHAPAKAAAGVIDPVVLEREIRARFFDARACRMEVARRKHVPPREIAAKSLALRWTILPSGMVNATEVVALSPTDGDLVTCLKSRMSQWRFTPPRGGMLSLDRPYSF
jgi:hypothetical protein